MKKIMLFVLAVFLIVYSLEEFYSFKPIQTIQISASHLLDYQNTHNHSDVVLCASNLISVFLVIYLINLITKKKHDYTLIFLGMLAGITSSHPIAGLILFGALLVYYLIYLPFVLGWQNATTAISYSLFFYVGTLIFLILSDYGLTLRLTFGIALGLVAYLIGKIIMESILTLYNITKTFINIITYRLNSQ